MNNDANLALGFYNLCKLNWPKHTMFEGPNAYKYERQYLIWIKVMSLFFEDKNFKIPKNHFLYKQNIKQMMTSYKKILNNEIGKDISNLVVECFDNFVEENKSFVSNNEICNDENIKKLSFRTYMLLLCSLKEKFMLPSLYLLSKENENEQEYYSKFIINTLANNTCDSLKMLSNYIKEQIIDDQKQILSDLLVLSNTMYAKMKIMRDLLVKDTNWKMGYYTSIENFFYMLPIKCKMKEDIGKLSVMNISYMNDPNEGKILFNYLNIHDEKKRNYRKDLRIPYVFFKSFTSQIDYLPMWEMYSNHSEGCCIVIDWKKTKEYSILDEIPLYYVFYIESSHGNLYINNEHNKHILGYENIKEQLAFLKDYYSKINNDLAKNYYKKITSNLQYFVKDASYSYEQEMRIIYNYSNISSDFCHTVGDYPLLFIHPDFTLQIDEIILGPKFKNVSMRIPYIQEEVAKMCQQIGCLMPIISISDIDFR